MTDNPKPLTRAEWEAYKRSHFPMPGKEGRRVTATLDALFRYRERTRGMFDPGRRNAVSDDDRDADTIAAEEGIE